MLTSHTGYSNLKQKGVYKKYANPRADLTGDTDRVHRDIIGDFRATTHPPLPNVNVRVNVAVRFREGKVKMP